MLFILPLTLMGAFLVPFCSSFVVIDQRRPPLRAKKHQGFVSTSTALFYQNYTRDTLEDGSFVVAPQISPVPRMNSERNRLKKELAVAAIEKYDIEAYQTGMTTVAEDIMKQLEPLRPWDCPAHHFDLNARWSFVFTGVPTIGMKLITLLSRISVGFPPIDFRDVFLEVSGQQTQVKAIVAVHILGVPIEFNVFTKLEPNTDDPHGTHLIETFQCIKLAGIEIPTPETWKRSRDLEITYLDQDMMIARTAGGEPHFLLRHSPCSTDDLECDIDNDVTEYFAEARAKYGQKLSRSLVDRAYGKDDDRFQGSYIVEIIQSILDGKASH